MTRSETASTSWQAPRRHEPSAAAGGARVHRLRPRPTSEVHRAGPGDGTSAGWSSEQYREACRLLPGFALLPSALLASLASYATYFDTRGPLLADDRDEVARAVTGRTPDAFGARFGDELPEVAARRRLVRRLAVKALEPFAPLEAEVATLLAEGLPARTIGLLLHALLAFRFLASLAAAMLLRPPRDGFAGV